MEAAKQAAKEATPRVCCGGGAVCGDCTAGAGSAEPGYMHIYIYIHISICRYIHLYIRRYIYIYIHMRCAK